MPSHLPTKPLKVTAYLSDDPVDKSEIIMLDGLLYEAWFAKNGATQAEKGGVKFVGLPFRQLTGNRWSVSRGIIGNSKIEWYCMGTKDKIKDLLMYITLIEEVHVESWFIEEADKDYSLIHPVYGLMRPTPVLEAASIRDLINLDDYPRKMYGVKPPYWKDKNQRLCYVPQKAASLE